MFLGVTTGGQAGVNWVGLADITVSDYAILTVCAVLGAWLGKVLRLPAAPVFGPMILSGVAHVGAWVTVPPPTLFVIGAQITIGTIIGTRFVGATLAEVRRDIGLSVIASFLLLIVAVVFAELIVLMTAIPLAQAFLAFSPGGLTEMSLLTLALDQDVAYVSVMHIVRITLVIAIAPFVFRMFSRRF